MAHKKDSPTLISLMTKDSIEPVTLLICRSDRAKFIETPEIAHLNQYVQVNGLVEVYKKRSQIILHSEKQISIAREAAPEEE